MDIKYTILYSGVLLTLNFKGSFDMMYFWYKQEICHVKFYHDLNFVVSIY